MLLSSLIMSKEHVDLCNFFGTQGNIEVCCTGTSKKKMRNKRSNSQWKKRPLIRNDFSKAGVPIANKENSK